MSMTDAEFKQLQRDIEAAYDRLDELQRQHEHETGQRYYPPLRVGSLIPHFLRRQAG